MYFFLFQERLLLQPTTVPAESVAFFAYLSTHNDASSSHHILAFDKVITNIGNAYHANMGAFIAPRSGIYVFIWTVRMNGHNYHTTELVHNNTVVNAIYLNPQKYRRYCHWHCYRTLKGKTCLLEQVHSVTGRLLVTQMVGHRLLAGC